MASVESLIHFCGTDPALGISTNVIDFILNHIKFGELEVLYIVTINFIHFFQLSSFISSHKLNSSSCSE